MPESEASVYAAFVATHEDRLVCSLVSETGLSRATALTVAADVLPAAHRRSFATSGAAYGWLRVAARHRAADAGGWADAADAALVRAHLAAAALAALPAGDRELLRLRYVDGLLPAAVAEHLGVPLAEVNDRLDRAVACAARALPAQGRPARRLGTLAVPLPRVAAALAATAAAILVAGGGNAPSAPLRSGPAPLPAALRPAVPGTPAAEPAQARSGADASVALGARTVVAPAKIVRPAQPGDDGAVPPGERCRTACAPSRLVDELHVALPSEASVLIGQDDVVIKQEAGNDHASVCDTVAMIPAGVASCVPAES